MMAERAELRIGAVDATQAAFASVSSRLTQLQGAAADVGARVGAVLPAVAAAFSVGAIAQFTRATIDGLDALNDLADATGASIANLGGLEDVAARTGTSFETVSSALVKLNQSLNAAEPDSGVARALQAIGLSAEELRQQDPTVALETIAKALAGFADDANKARLTQEIFGRSVGRVAPLLKDLAERGLQSSDALEAQAKQAEAFNQALFGLSKSATDAGRSLVSEVLPSLTQAVNIAKDAEIFELFGKAIRTVAETLLVLGANVSFVFKGIGREIGAIAAQATALATLDFKGFRAISEAVKEDGKRAREELERFEKRVLGGPQQVTVNGSDFSDRSRGRTGPSLPSVVVPPGAGRAAGDAIKRETDAFFQAQDAVEERIREGLLRVLDSEVEANRKALEDRSKAIEALVSQTNIGRAAALREQLKLLNEEFLLQGGEDSSSAIGQAIVRVEQQLRDLEPASKSAETALSTFADQASRNIQDALGTTLEQVLSGNFKSIGQLWSQLIIRMLAQAQAAKLNEALFGGGPGGLDLGRLIGSLFGGFNGNNGSAGINGGSTILPNSLRGGAATGANALERDMITLVHKGEAIVPKAYNPAAGGARVTVNNYSGAEVQTRQRDDGGLDIDILTRAVEQRMAGNVASARGPMAGALRARGLNSSPSLARMG